MDELYKIIKLASDNDLCRTIVNFRFSIDRDTHSKLYNNIQLDLINNNNYINLLFNKISNIREIRACFKTKKNNNSITFINPNYYYVNTKSTKDKNLHVNIIHNGINTNLLHDYLNYACTSFDSFIKKKKFKKKTLIKLFNANHVNSYSMTQTRYHIIESKFDMDAKESHVKFKLILELDNEKIITQGRLLLPNSIGITLSNRSRIILYNNYKIQIILSKGKNETFTKFVEFTNNVLNTCFDIINIYTNILYTSNIIKDLYINCDFNYRSDKFKYPVFFNNKHIRFFGKNKINIKTITNYDTINNILISIKNIEQELQYVYNNLESINPFDSNITDINYVINEIQNIKLK
ncbi:DNA-directed RNA polymerase beta chain [Alphaentomopoxvirus acuprea]|uniref:DNA-directed RNA polymerase beta chain n=1 Tax=Alphaentomopoxvirus acuprea TaxID=62099 RepID=W6JL37_9POXV|nr:DNA-directed RNA polymerase beta chain [Anomala cuprea entomopoxvirus]BAO49550.1 DNA-directed RNA polymerase beta chain [Anomala cuprea entomopoxvirus]